MPKRVEGVDVDLVLDDAAEEGAASAGGGATTRVDQTIRTRSSIPWF
jgi:hypothetical protein